MKNYIALLFIVKTFVLSAQQNVGIGTQTPHPKAILDLTSTDKGLLLPRVADTNAVTGVKPAGLVIYSLADQSSYVYTGTYWKNLESSQLEKITEGGRTGWRLLGRDPNNYGDIGADAVDLSSSATNSSIYGATGDYSTAMGLHTTASGYGSTTMGIQTTASDFYSTAMGRQTTASGYVSTAMGENTIASGNESTAMGFNTTASGVGSTAMGSLTTASGDASTAMGRQTKSTSLYSVAIGAFNDTISGSSSIGWVGTDPLFMVGNGNNSTNRSNALTVYKNGNNDISGYTRLGKASEGAPRIKQKLVLLNSPGSEGANIPMPHGVSYPKIISITAVLDYGTGTVTPGYRFAAGYEFALSYDATSVYISNQAANSANILNKPVKVFITYEE